MKIGTKSVLFGAHQFLVHPCFVAYAWWKLYGFPFDIRLWISFFIHDLGYFGKSNMDGEEGELHPWFAAKIMVRLFGVKWGEFCLFHSRFLAKRYNQKYSKLCVADKLSIAIEPWWLYLPRAILSGEVYEYMELAKKRTEAGEPKYATANVYSNEKRQWFANVQNYCYKWAQKHRYGIEDTWTPKNQINSNQ